MFSDFDFLEKTCCAGLTEVNLSVHSCNEKIYESITLVKNSFNDLELAISNLVKKEIKLYASVVVLKLNLFSIQDTIKYLISNGFQNVQLQSFIPYESILNSEDLVFSYSDFKRELFDLDVSVAEKVIFSDFPFCLFDEKIISAGMVENKPREDRWENHAPKKIKFNFCKRCIKNEVCAGFFELYVRKFGLRGLEDSFLIDKDIFFAENSPYLN